MPCETATGSIQNCHTLMIMCFWSKNVNFFLLSCGIWGLAAAHTIFIRLCYGCWMVVCRFGSANLWLRCARRTCSSWPSNSQHLWVRVMVIQMWHMYDAHQWSIWIARAAAIILIIKMKFKAPTHHQFKFIHFQFQWTCRLFDTNTPIYYSFITIIVVNAPSSVWPNATEKNERKRNVNKINGSLCCCFTCSLLQKLQ